MTSFGVGGEIDLLGPYQLLRQPASLSFDEEEPNK